MTRTAIATLADGRRPLVIDTLGSPYTRQHRPGHCAFISPTAQDLRDRKDRRNVR